MWEAEEERRRLQALRTTASADAERWDATARELQAVADEVDPLLVDVLEDWTPDVLAGAAAERGWLALLDQRHQLLEAVRELEDGAAQARRLAAEGRAEAASAQDALARLALVAS